MERKLLENSNAVEIWVDKSSETSANTGRSIITYQEDMYKF